MVSCGGLLGLCVVSFSLNMLSTILFHFAVEILCAIALESLDDKLTSVIPMI